MKIAVISDIHGNIEALDLKNGRQTTPWQVTIRRVGYDIEKAVAQLFEGQHPAADLGAYNLRSARPVGQRFSYRRPACEEVPVGGLSPTPVIPGGVEQ